jgi:methylated-DNA-[protein]-cysteine S-methyltransferase
MRLQLDRYASPLAQILLVTDDDGAVRALDFADYDARLRRLLHAHYGDVELTKGAAPSDVMLALDAYFAGDLAAVDAIRIATGGTAFQRDVWKALRAIPPGATKSYGRIAKEIGRPAASRAVGAANGANPIAIIVPCHRVIGAGGALTGYGGGLPRKQWLLDHERTHAGAHAGAQLLAAAS